MPPYRTITSNEEPQIIADVHQNNHSETFLVPVGVSS